jgi:hypothetical protein
MHQIDATTHVVDLRIVSGRAVQELFVDPALGCVVRSWRNYGSRLERQARDRNRR